MVGLKPKEFMADKNMVIKLTDYKYPTKKEWLEVAKNLPDFNSFDFSNVSIPKLIFEFSLSFQEVNRLNNLFVWDNILSKDLWSLKHSFINAIVNYNRKIAIKSEEFKEKSKVVNLLQYEFYSQSCFINIISTRDTILQIVNVYLMLDLKDNRISPDKVLKKVAEVKNIEIFEVIERICSGLSNCSEIRNSLIHRYSKLVPDRRTSLVRDNSVINGPTNNFITYPKQIEILTSSVDLILNELLEMKSIFNQLKRQTKLNE